VRRESWTAFDEFVQVHGDSLIGLAFVLCGDRGRAEDATQEALTRLYLRWGRIDDPLPYARRSVINATNDHGRRSGRRERREQLAAQLEPPEAPMLVDDQVADRDRLIRALRRLPHGQRTVIVLRYWHQLPESEIAQILGNSVGTVKSQASRALDRLRSELQSDLLPVNPSPVNPSPINPRSTGE
jgi:RNA polymerase sigma-70 factor (sigma-E family)